jgi:membrane associated rhomboid family serine protease
MGIYDREYYRRDGPGFLESLTSQGKVCQRLIILNAIIFGLQTFTRQAVFDGPITSAFILNVSDVFHGEVWRLLTYAFLHDGIWHIVFNMLFLYWFGKDMEDIYGSREFLAFYLTAAFLGGVAYSLEALVRNRMDIPCLGASGAVTAVMVLFALHYPRNVIYLFMILPVPIWLFVAFQVLQDTLTFLSREETRTAVVVHLAGAAFGFLYYKNQWRVLNLVPNFRGWQRERARPKLRVYREEEATAPVSVAAPTSASADVDEQLEAKLDAVLEKVARFGQASLTESERQILFRASEVYKKRRS